MKIGQYKWIDREPLTLDSLEYGDVLRFEGDECYVFVGTVILLGGIRRGLVFTGSDHSFDAALKIAGYVMRHPLQIDADADWSSIDWEVIEYRKAAIEELGLLIEICVISERELRESYEVHPKVQFPSAIRIRNEVKIGQYRQGSEGPSVLDNLEYGDVVRITHTLESSGYGSGYGVSLGRAIGDGLAGQWIALDGETESYFDDLKDALRVSEYFVKHPFLVERDNVSKYRYKERMYRELGVSFYPWFVTGRMLKYYDIQIVPVVVSFGIKLGQHEQVDKKLLTLDDLKRGYIVYFDREGEKNYWVVGDVKVGARIGFFLSIAGDYLLNDILKISKYVRENPPVSNPNYSFADYIKDARRDLGVSVMGSMLGNEWLEAWEVEVLPVVDPLAPAEMIKLGQDDRDGRYLFTLDDLRYGNILRFTVIRKGYYVFLRHLDGEGLFLGGKPNFSIEDAVEVLRYAIKHPFPAGGDIKRYIRDVKKGSGLSEFYKGIMGEVISLVFTDSDLKRYEAMLVPLVDPLASAEMIKIGQGEQANGRPLTLDNLKCGDIVRYENMNTTAYYVFVAEVICPTDVTGTFSGPIGMVYGTHKDRCGVFFNPASGSLGDAVKISEYVKDHPFQVGVDREYDDSAVLEYQEIAEKKLGFFVSLVLISDRNLRHTEEGKKVEVVSVIPMDFSDQIKLGQERQLNKKSLVFDNLEYGDVIFLPVEGSGGGYVIYLGRDEEDPKWVGIAVPIESGDRSLFDIGDALQLSKYLIEHPLSEKRKVVPYVIPSEYMDEVRRELGFGFRCQEVMENSFDYYSDVEVVSVAPPDSTIKLGQDEAIPFSSDQEVQTTKTISWDAKSGRWLEGTEGKPVIPLGTRGRIVQYTPTVSQVQFPEISDTSYYNVSGSELEAYFTNQLGDRGQYLPNIEDYIREKRKLTVKRPTTATYNSDGKTVLLKVQRGLEIYPVRDMGNNVLVATELRGSPFYFSVPKRWFTGGRKHVAKVLVAEDVE